MTTIRIDFDNPGLPKYLDVMEDDSQSRFFTAELYRNGAPYSAPSGSTYSIMYRGPGAQNQGWYDTIEDGNGTRAACSVSGNVVTCEIARKALQVPGHVTVVLCVTSKSGYMLKGWPIECDCRNDHYDNTAEVSSYFFITKVQNASWTQAIQALETLRTTIDSTLTLSGRAAEAKATGDKIAAEKTRATGEESRLNTAINSEATRAKNAESANASAISTEKNRATSKESELSTSITSETTRAKGAEKANTDAIGAEKTRAQQAESTLSGKISDLSGTVQTLGLRVVGGKLCAVYTPAQTAAVAEGVSEHD